MKKKKKASKKASKEAAISLAETQDAAARKLQVWARRQLAVFRERRARWQEQEEAERPNEIMKRLDEEWREKLRAMYQPGYFASLHGGKIVVRKPWLEEPSKSKLEMQSDIELVFEVVRSAEAKRIQRERAERAALEQSAALERPVREARAERQAWRDLSRCTRTTKPQARAPRKKAGAEPPGTPSMSEESFEEAPAVETGMLQGEVALLEA